MKKLIIAFIFSALPGLLLASEGVHLDKAHVDVSNKASLQHGAKLFVNYCLSCHSAAFQRYNRMGQDLGLSDEQVKENLMFATDKVGSVMTVAMPVADAKAWFGNPPPDLSVIARARGADWIYTYLRSFYIDEKKATTGMNNTVFPDVGMPHVLWELQGLQKPVYKTEMHEGKETHTIVGFEQVTEGKMTPAEYDQAMLDLTSFLVYMGEPAQLQRKRIGVWVLLFLGILFIFAYALKKEYWKDIH